MEKKRIYYWDNLKCLLIFLVVLGHFLIPVLSDGRSIQAVYYFVYLFHMPAFIFVSGYFAKSYIKKGAPNINKLTGFLILYLVYKVLIWAVDSLLAGKYTGFEIFTESSAPWYMLGMFAWLLMLPLFAKFKGVVSITVTIVLGLVIGFEDYFNAFLCLSRIFVFLPFFLAGYYFKGEFVQRLTSRKVRILSAVFLCICLVTVILKLDWIKSFEGMLYGNRSYHIFIKIISQNKAMLVRAGWYAVAFITTFAVMSLIPKRKLIISYIGERTLAIYIVHRLIRTLFTRYDLYHMVSPGGIGLLVFCVVVSAVLTFILSGRRLSELFQRVFKISYNKFLIKEDMEG